MEREQESAGRSRARSWAGRWKDTEVYPPRRGSREPIEGLLVVHLGDREVDLQHGANKFATQFTLSREEVANYIQRLSRAVELSGRAEESSQAIEPSSRAEQSSRAVEPSSQTGQEQTSSQAEQSSQAVEPSSRAEQSS